MHVNGEKWEIYCLQVDFIEGKGNGYLCGHSKAGANSKSQEGFNDPHGFVHG